MTNATTHLPETMTMTLTANTADVATAVTEALAERRPLVVGALAKRAGTCRATAGRALSSWYATGALRFCGADGEPNAHTHVTFQGQVFPR